MVGLGSKSARKRKKAKQQQQAADANGSAPELAQPVSNGSHRHGPALSDLQAPLDTSVLAATQASIADQALKQSAAEPHGSEAQPHEPSSEANTKDSRPSAQREHSGSAPNTPNEQTSPRASGKRKSVRFHLRENLFFEPGGQVPPAAVRTPPKARPKVRFTCCPRPIRNVTRASVLRRTNVKTAVHVIVHRAVL